MSATTADKFSKARRKFTTTIGVGGILAGGSSLPLTSVTGLPTDTPVVLMINPGGTTEEVVKGVVSGSNIVTLSKGLEGTTDNPHSAGEVVVNYFTQQHWNDLIDGILVSHKADGTHAASIALTTPKITTSINDASGNEVIRTPATSSAVNDITVTNAVTTAAPLISATGDDTNIDLKIKPKGTGVIKLENSSGTDIAKGLGTGFAVTNPYMFSAVSSVDQTSVHTTDKLTFPTELFDTGSNFASSTFTAPVAGYYMIRGQTYVSSEGGVFFRATIYKNGSAFRFGPSVGNGTNSDSIRSVEELMLLAANDTIDIRASFTGGGTLTIAGSISPAPCVFQGWLVSL